MFRFQEFVMKVDLDNAQMKFQGVGSLAKEIKSLFREREVSFLHFKRMLATSFISRHLAYSVSSDFALFRLFLCCTVVIPLEVWLFLHIRN